MLEDLPEHRLGNWDGVPASVLEVDFLGSRVDDDVFEGRVKVARGGGDGARDGASRGEPVDACLVIVEDALGRERDDGLAKKGAQEREREAGEPRLR